MPNQPSLRFSLLVAPAVLLVKLGALVRRPASALRSMAKLLSPDRVAALESYAPTKHDVFVAVFAKSGTNLSLQIAQQISALGEAEFGHIHDVVPWPDIPHPKVVRLDDRGLVERSPTGLRVIKTHAPLTLVPYAAEAKYLMVIRDPKEVLVSAYHFFLDSFGVKHRITPQQWIELSLKPNMFCAHWARHTASAWAMRERPNCLVLDFAELLAQRRRAVEQIAALMEVELSEAVLEAVLERSSFEHMRANETQFHPPKFPFVRERATMIRSGKSGRSGELLTPEQQGEIDEVCRAELARLGSDYPYDARHGQSPKPG